jgi:hypothetical protein
LAFELCSAGIEPLDDGPEDCGVTSVMTWPEVCQASLECSRPAVAAERELLAWGYMTASCRLEGETYECRCSATEESDEFEVEALDTETACAAAAERCPELLSAAFGVGIFQD